MRPRYLCALVWALSALVVADRARAQSPAPTAPPPGTPPYAPAPPPGWYAPAPEYGPPPAYAPPPTWQRPAELPYHEGRRIPEGYHPETRARRGLVITGTIFLGTAYALSLSVAASSRYEPDRWLYLPLIG